MPIIKAVKTDSGIPVAYHKAAKLTVDLTSQTATASVQSYADEAAAGGLAATWNWTLPVDIKTVLGATDVLAGVETALTGTGAMFEGGQVVTDTSDSLDALKARKRAEITQDRINADADHFTYQGKSIRTADKDMMDLLVADARWNKGLPSNWPGGWKAVDDTYVAIGTKDDWDAFFIAMYDAGISNFDHSQKLKAQLDAATTPEDVAAVKW